MRIVVVGAGKVGRVLTEQLAAEKHDIVVIDQDSDLIESIVNIYDGQRRLLRHPEGRL